jgi:hypothetical protein
VIEETSYVCTEIRIKIQNFGYVGFKSCRFTIRIYVRVYAIPLF